MITANGYSQDPSIMPEGIAVTFGQEMMAEQGGMKNFLRVFRTTMEGSLNEEDTYWMHKCSNLPTREVDTIYIIVANRLWGRVYCGGYRNGNENITCWNVNGIEKTVNWNHIILSGPFEHCPFKRTLKGFQGFRYTSKLF